MIETIKKLLLVSRPISWANTAFPFAAGYLVSGGSIDLVFIIATIYFLWPYNLMLYGINDVFDYESDILNPRKGGVEGMREQRSFHPTIIKGTLLLNIPFVIYLLSAGDLVSNITLLLVVFFALAYSIAKLRFKEKPVLDSITSSLHFVGPLVYALTLTTFSPSAWPYVIAFFLWGMASQAFGAVQDIVPDRKAGLHSIATKFGAKWTVRFAILLYGIAALLTSLQGGLAIFVGLAGLLYVLNCVTYWNITDADSARTNQAWRRFIWLNYPVGFVVTIALILSFI